VRWYRLSALQEFAVAQNNLGWMYDQGRGVERNYEEAARWYRRAAEQELPNAQFNLAAMYEAGFGVSQDINEAVRWYGKAAAQHHEQAKARIVLLAPRVPAAADVLDKPEVAASDVTASEVADAAEPAVEPASTPQPNSRLYPRLPP
jgi:hypothetical protein